MAEINHYLSVPIPRFRALVVPREHGAWGMLLVPLFTGTAVGSFAGRNFGSLASLIACALLLFWLRTPVESLLGTQPIKAQTAAEKKAVLAMCFGLSFMAAGFLATLFWNGRNSFLLMIGLVAASSFGLQAILRKISRKTRVTSQMIGSFGLCSTAAAAYCTVVGAWDRTALILWIANWLFAANQVHFVQLSIHHWKLEGGSNRIRQGRSFLAGNLVLIAVLAMACLFYGLPLLLFLAFVPVLYRGLHWFAEGVKPLNVRALGWSEMRQAVGFDLLLVFAFSVKHFSM